MWKGRAGAQEQALHRAKCAAVRAKEKEQFLGHLAQSSNSLSEANKGRADVKEELERLKQAQKESWNQQNPGQGSCKG